MPAVRVNSLLAVFLSYALLTNADEIKADDVTVSTTTTTAPEPPALLCYNQLDDGTIVSSDDCMNGRGLSGCCVERAFCDYSTPNIDLTLYGPPGYRSSCEGKYVCCPLQHVLPLKVSTETQDDDEIDMSDDV
ncbi:uncharacterized protein LOC142985121 isoform X2 [Anticarsia gemmatalis]|uniref:uncharacterized protein LOC142985121 isoform X2 n=1 Tax=Anticarsia gemmatalis TaxID=129554 RepID=UPI003F772FDC